MIQIFRLPQSGASTCPVFSGKYYDRIYICSRCLRNPSIMRNRSDSSVFRPAVDKKIVKTRRSPLSKRVKETELLKVTKTQTTQTTMTIAKLNASHIAAFVEEPGMILKNVKYTKSIRDNGRPDLFSSNTLKFEKEFSSSMSGNMENLNDSVSPLRNMPDVNKSKPYKTQYSKGESIEKIQPKNIETVTIKKLPSTMLSNCLSVENSLGEMNSQSAFKENTCIKMGLADGLCESNLLQEDQKSHAEKPRENFEEPEEKIDTTFNSYFGVDLVADASIHPYIDVCVHCGLLDRAFQLLTKFSLTTVKNPEVYHTLLRGFSERGDWLRADILVGKMENLNVPCTPQTFALQLLSVAQGEVCDALERTAEILQKLENKGFEINDLFTKTRLKIDERENVLKQIRKIVPLFDIAPSAVNLNSNCPLVAKLYQDQHPLTSPAPFINKDFVTKAVEEQLSLEDEQICTIKKIGGDLKYSAKHRKIWLQLNEMWKIKFRNAFQSCLKVLKAEFELTRSKNCVYPYLLTSPTETFVKLAMEEIDQLVQLSQSYSDNTFIIYERLGQKVYQMYCKSKKISDEKFNKRMKKQIEMYCTWYANPIGPARNARQKWQMLMGDNPDMAIMSSENVVWPTPVKVMVGKFLYNIIFKSAVVPGRWAKSTLDVPAFYLVLRQKSGKVSEEVKFHPILSTILKKANINIIKFPVDQLPMLCPPKPWSTPDNGGYYFLSAELLRVHFGNINRNYLKSVPNQNLYAIYDSLNKLQSVPWKINEKVLDVAIQVFSEGGSKELDVPVKPDTSPLENIPKNLDFQSKYKAYQERVEVLRERHDQYGLWCEGLYKLSLANHYRNKVFWLPQNLDFRGRVYPVPPHVSHVTSDLYRSLLLFAKKQRLGEKGLDWLKIHVINLTGAHKKKSIRERLEYANQILPDIVDSAENPLEGKRWWTESDDPWQTLAACMEIRDVLKCDDPKMFESGFPIHQDGSCNGLQHYAALGRDTFGAASVNLMPSATPQDVYSDVANLIEEERAKDEAAGVEIAKLLKGFVSRKVVKRPVMTTVYGVTWYGANLQIAGVLSDIPEFPQNLVSPASSYLATKIFESLRKLFTSAKEIQDWFNECSDVITRDCSRSISWENPIGLPVIQPYFKKDKPHNTMKPDPRKQKNAFAPNFIHSLDSTHMMLTALHCEPAGLTFASVHDCFWTHPSSVDVMNRICRECFVELHSLDILETLSKHFIRNYAIDENSEKCKVFTAIPKLGNFDLNTVKDSVYFFA